MNENTVAAHDEEFYITQADQYTEESAKEILLKFGEMSVPLAALMQEIYTDRRLIFFSNKEICSRFLSTVDCFFFYYRQNILFCSDEQFDLSGGEYEWNIHFQPLESVKLQENDLFFAFDFYCKKKTITAIRQQHIRGLKIEVFRKAYIGALYHYARRLRPAINFAALHPGVQLVLVDNFQIPKDNLTEWEKYISRNHLTREKMVEKLKQGENPYPCGLYSKAYTAQELLQMHIVPARTVDQRGVLHIQDYESRFLNVIDGKRVTVGQPTDFTRSVHIFGGCGFFGIGLPDEATFASQLQQLLNKCAPQERLRVVNHGCFIWGCQDAMWYILNDIDYADGDVVVLPYNQKWAQYFYKNIENIDYADITARRVEDGEIFNDTWHPSENGIKLYANNLYQYLHEKHFFINSAKRITETSIRNLKRPKQFGVPDFADSAGQSTNTTPNQLLVDGAMKSQLNQYLLEIKKERMQIGSIVMNCNPFTLGHRYLIEYASKKVDKLYIFAVEEDKSFFPFQDRINLIRQGTADLPNVTVLPSGKFIISSLTFTDYFGKAEKQDKQIDATLDVEIFGRYIAPALGINIRFAGEEPLDAVTRQYNEQMHKILPQYGVAFEEIPRKQSGGAVISASRVRKLLQEKRFDEIKQLVPLTTVEYLINKFA